jgi:hypothetical protein
MTPDEILSEVMYRVKERLGILCGDAKPTAEQLSIAWGEARRWESEYKSKGQKELL